MRTLKAIIFSNRLTAMLFIVFATALAFGTFIESWYSTQTAKIWIYNAKWFEALFLLFIINFSGNIFKYRLLRKEKWAVLLLHLSFIIIIIGAGVTRYFGYEGVMPIREGQTENQFLSEKTFLTIHIDGELNGEPLRKTLENQVMFSEHTSNSLRWKSNFGDQKFKIELLDYTEDVMEDLVLDNKGHRFLKLVESSTGQRHNHFIKEGEVLSAHHLLFSFNKIQEGAINIRLQDGQYFINSPFQGTIFRMMDQQRDSIRINKEVPLAFRSLYQIGDFAFVFPEPALRGHVQYVKNLTQEGLPSALSIEIETAGESKTVQIIGGKGFSENPQLAQLGGLDFYINYGSKLLTLPFSLKLYDFIAEKYPGTEKSYSSFKSKVQVIDQESFDYDIYMNHVLDHRGYRFFQSSFDPDEGGTILSVNHDWWGTYITYTGYILLYISLMGIFFIGHTRFKNQSKLLNSLIKKRNALLVIISLGVSSAISAQDTIHQRMDYDSLIQTSIFDEKPASEFGKLVIQDFGGRMKPANTFSSELLRKVTKSDTYKNMNADQVMLSMMYNPLPWYNVPMVSLKRGNDSLRKSIGLPTDVKRASLLDFFDSQGEYKIAQQLEQAYRRATPNQFQKDFIETDRKVNLLYSALEGQVYRIFPIPNDQSQRWVSYPELSTVKFETRDSIFVNNILPLYMQALRSGKSTGDYTEATSYLDGIKNFQKRYGAEIIPTRQKIELEILYNRIDIFKNLYRYYIYFGTVLFLLLIFQIFKSNRATKTIIKVFVGIIIGLLAIHTLGLVARWILSGHAPWSDAYESMIYVAWATQLFGLLFGRKNAFAIAATSFVTGMILMIAHWNWMDPAIANLVPVLNSYWLMIHVAIIVASYGPFSLSMIIGAVVLLLMLYGGGKKKQKVKDQIKELTIINELSLTVGLVMLTIGNFLGGMWANESWGRYWGWDPKETWALISILIYAFVVHMRLVPTLKGPWLFNLMSVMAYGSILMTYFGVNFYLVGLHSYASGDKIITPDFVYVAFFSVATLGLLSKWRSKALYSN
ncbi:MAG: cytochrome c biogenesis protein CcsA [Flavobacteriaceae bacterium]|nr:cytochrome c biogenesis protein CcsA [Flavobacteriaceae bacterium]MCY4254269.1 cytochrome c biogenesis protein CcsA [Flavobacteriaceae bacterium]